jgi:hypothetical protein
MAIEIDVTYAPKTPGDVTVPLHMIYSSPCDVTQGSIVTGTGVDDIVRATLSIDAHRGAPDAVLAVPVVLGTDLGGLDVRSFEGAVSFNPTMLHPRRVYATGALASAMNLTWQHDRTGGSVVVQASGAAVAAGTGPLYYIEFEVLVGDAVETPLTIAPTFAFTSGRARVETRRDGRFTLEGYCLVEGTRLVRPVQGFALHGNAPNPFNPSTTVTFELDRDGLVDLTVFDATGRPVAVLVAGEVKAGVHRVVFDASVVPSGMYTCVLRHEGRVRMHPMLLVR